jgi:hypothetical protein
VSKEYFKTRSELQREYEQQLKSMRTIKDYLNVSEKVIYSNLHFILTNFENINRKIFIPEAIEMLISLVQRYWDSNNPIANKASVPVPDANLLALKDVRIPVACFLVFIKWTLLERYGIHSFFFSFFFPSYFSCDDALHLKMVLSFIFVFLLRLSHIQSRRPNSK